MGIVKQHKASCNNASGQAVTRLPHDHIDDGDGEGAQKSWHRSEGDIWDLIRDVGVADVLEVEVAIISDCPANEGEK